MKVLCIGAHPDDVEMGMGGTIAKHAKQGDEVIIILVSLGGVSGKHDIRRKEAKKAAKTLGASELRILDYSVFKLNNPKQEFVSIIKNIIDEFVPDRVYTHSPYDFHQVHVGVSKCVIKAAKKTKQIFFFETISSTTTKFAPNAFVDISKFINVKLAGLKAHKTQSDRFYIKPNVIKSLANTRYVWGKVGPNSSGFAEGFIIHKMTV